jgi:hypothetical protein
MVKIQCESCKEFREDTIIWRHGNYCPDCSFEDYDMIKVEKMIKPYPYEAYRKAFNLMVDEAAEMFDLYEGDKFTIGFNAYAPWQLLYLQDGNWQPTIRMYEDDDNFKYFWEMAYSATPAYGCYLTLKKGDSHFTEFHGERCYAKNEYFEFMPTFMLENKGD